MTVNPPQSLAIILDASCMSLHEKTTSMLHLTKSGGFLQCFDLPWSSCAAALQLSVVWLVFSRGLFLQLCMHPANLSNYPIGIRGAILKAGIVSGLPNVPEFEVDEIHLQCNCGTIRILRDAVEELMKPSGEGIIRSRGGG